MRVDFGCSASTLPVWAFTTRVCRGGASKGGAGMHTCKGHEPCERDALLNCGCVAFTLPVWAFTPPSWKVDEVLVVGRV